MGVYFNNYVKRNNYEAWDQKLGIIMWL